MTAPFAPFVAAASGPRDFSHYPQDVGIIALDIYFPQQYVTQSSLETHMNVSAGKFTIGLGQTEMAFVTDREDIYSITLTAVSQFMSKYKIPYSAIGRLEVGTETISDHSKAVKTVLMQLFKTEAAKAKAADSSYDDSSISDIEGIDCMNACYGGTNALFNSCDWIESSSYDGRFALAVAADIAEYAEGVARPTGGVGAVVMLIGPNAPLVLERGVRATHMEHAYDFFKPNLDSPHPVVDGKFSGICYLRALDICYRRYRQKYDKQYNNSSSSSSNKSYSFVTDADAVLFHAPYNKLVQKSYARLMYQDMLQNPTHEAYNSSSSSSSNLQQYLTTAAEASYTDTALERAFVAASSSSYSSKVLPSTLLPVRLGNMYTASLYAGLLSLVAAAGAAIAGKQLLLFSYGSGLAASMFSIRVGTSAAAKQQLELIATTAALATRLAARTERSCVDLYHWMQQREQLHQQHAAWPLTGAVAVGVDIAAGSYYLNSRDESGRRTYRRAGDDESDSSSDIPLPH